MDISALEILEVLDVVRIKNGLIKIKQGRHKAFCNDASLQKAIWYNFSFTKVEQDGIQNKFSAGLLKITIRQILVAPCFQATKR